MQVYLVGGAVRDELLGRPVSERDWVVVGATPAQMEALGYRAVGRDFPVYLHPDTHEEYALARLERKVAPGYRGFTTEFSAAVSLQDDLARRDLTVNAMARSLDGTLIDPYGGRSDLGQRRLRHVSAAFVEDPVRILRVARFAARFAALGFTVALETMALMRSMVASGEASALVAERLWREMQRALTEPHPEEFFKVLQACGALRVLMPEIQIEPAALQTLVAAAQLSADDCVRFAALTAAATPEQIQALCARLRIPNEHRELALLTVRLQARIATAAATAADASSAAALLELLEAADALRRPERFSKLLLVCEAGAATGGAIASAGDSGGEDASDGADQAGRIPWAPGRLLDAARTVAAAATLAPQELATLKGPEIAACLRARRTAAIATLR